MPFYIFGIFLNIASSGETTLILNLFIKLIIFVFIVTAALLFVLFGTAGFIVGKNPLTLLKNMMPAYITALGTQSSAATIPVTLKQTLLNDVEPSIANFVIPLCATVNLPGSIMKIVACSMAVMLMNNMPINFSLYCGFICMLAVIMVAAPGVPGGAIMASIGILQSMLGFDQTMIGLMIALHMTMDSFGTATNVVTSGAVAVIINKIYKNDNPRQIKTQA
ncbi:Proton/sodium-glutamate symport protein [termite gut metagenome]|uniref:Proton/sodium-glutamate symport protein n=1 Tax=termite gut metagenome TaxID=433724 RepID=A0A5J4Q612_9ZZZZ